MVSVTDKKWYVIRAVTGQEAKVKKYITTELARVGLDSQVEDILVPTEKIIQIRKGKKVQKEKTYFPGYIMIKADISGEILHIIRSITNVLGFLGETKGGEPIPLRTSEVNRMLGKVDEGFVIKACVFQSGGHSVEVLEASQGGVQLRLWRLPGGAYS